MVFVGIALAAEHFLIIRVGRARRPDTLLAAQMSFVMIAAGMTGAHVFKFISYPEVLAHDPLMAFRHSAGIASFGGIFGGPATALVHLRFRRQPPETLLRYLDVSAWVFPFVWIVGRTACFLSHDHPRVLTTSLGVQYPEPRYFGWTVDQYAPGSVTLIGFAVPAHVFLRSSTGNPCLRGPDERPTRSAGG